MGRVSVWEALLLGVVEGLTEFVPVSSTGHLTLLFHLLDLPVQEEDFLKTFLIAIQLGAILAILLLYGRRFAVDRALWLRIGLAFLPTGAMGFLLYGFIRGEILGNDGIVVFFLFSVGLLLLLADRLAQRARYGDVLELPLHRVLLIGVFQGLAALFPGTSRSGATILGGLLLGLRRRAAAEFSFLLALPTMAVAVGYDLYRSAPAIPEGGWFLLGIGFLSAMVTAFLTVRWMLGFVERFGFRPFAYYRMALAAVYAYFFLG
ncbi:undecaprenyl-diphosphate phosphatase [Thermus thermamylovorans]|uniref:Undecaprenyl-diphosphatase n=1 Tax=Thermus thermamylovorans TaxID=2509362 RepID=A0A4V2IV36_9DEIN|nr:undecaprenyl-diphosphate phosphatase [Thermus thermamylovorans]TBH20764.1 undecaprenyl-diphosphate phosphatase [Thermus thermamylovorans]